MNSKSVAHQSRVLFSSGMPHLKHDSESCLVFYDKNLMKHSIFKKWVRQFPFRLAVKSGESLKSLEAFQRLAKKALDTLPKLKGQVRIVAVGGGSVGDSIGFLASTLKRGLPLIHVPSTWLAALDSSHGGKTALNLGKIKNQIGTFYPAEEIHVSKALLLTQAQSRLDDVQGELLKTCLLSGGSLWSWYEAGKSNSAEILFQKLPMLISVKSRIVKKDPLDRKGIRALLNFGHTFGHVLELENKMPHGTAVYHGVHIALGIGHHLGWTPESVIQQIGGWNELEKSFHLLPSEKNLLRILQQDKKRSGKGAVNFIFLKKPGSAFVKSISISELIAAAIEVKRAF